MAVTLRQIAEAAGVSVATASRVLSDHPYPQATDETRDRVLKAAHNLGYHPSAAARALVGGRTHVIAVACERPDDPHPVKMLRAVHGLARAFGYHVLLAPGSEVTDMAALLRERRVDVVLWARNTINEAGTLLDAVCTPHQVVIAVGSPITAPPRVLTAYWEQREGIEAVVSHLVGLGHQDIAFLAGHRGETKEELFLESASAQRIAGRVVRVAREDEPLLAGAQMARMALALDPVPTAIFARNDEIAIGALHALHEAGVRVPEEISVAGYNDIAVAAYCSPSLTTLTTPYVECAEYALTIALQALTRRNGSPPEPRAVRFPTRLQARQSTAPAPPEPYWRSRRWPVAQVSL